LLSIALGLHQLSRPTVALGHFGAGKINENGQGLLELCSLFNLFVASSFFKGLLRSKVTWIHPRSRWHQLDHHVIIRKRQLRDLKQCCSMHSADCRTDHALVRYKLQITLKKFRQTRPKPLPLVDVSSTHDSLRNQRFQQLLSSKLDSATLPADPNIAWCTTRDVIVSSALEAYGQRSKAQPDWFRDNVDLLLPAVAAKRSARLKVTVRNSRSAHRDLQAAKCTVPCLTRFAVSRYWKNLSTRIQQCADCSDLHGLHSGIREATGPIPKKLSTLLAADGALLVDTFAQLERWVDHYISIYSQPPHVGCSTLSSLQ